LLLRAYGGGALATITAGQGAICSLLSNAVAAGVWGILVLTAGYAAEPGPSAYIYAIGGDTMSANCYQYNQRTDSWSTKTACPVSRDASAGFVIGTAGYVVGNDGDTNKDQHYRYDPDVWASRAVYPNDIYGAAGSNRTTAGEGIVQGGVGHETQTQVYTEDAWVAKTSMTGGGKRHSASELSNSVYVFNGMNSTGTIDNKVNRWSGSAWAAMTTRPGPLSHHTVTAPISTKIYAVGGINGNYYYDHVYQFTSTGFGSWAVKQDFPLGGRYGGGFGTADGYGFHVGGRKDGLQTGRTKECMRYDASTDSWSSRQDCTIARHRLGESTLGITP